MIQNSANNVSLNPHISWSAVLAGVILSVTIAATFIVLGTAFGLSIMDFKDGISMTATSWGTGLWIIIFGCVSIFSGSFVAGRLSGNITDFAGMINGTLVWALLSIMTIYMLISSAVSTSAKAFNSVASIASTAISAGSGLNLNSLKAVVANDPDLKKALESFSLSTEDLSKSVDDFKAPELKQVVQAEGEKLQNRLTQILVQTLKDPNELRANLDQAKGEIRKSFENIRSTLTQDKVEKIMAANTKMSKAEIDEIYKNWQVKMDDMTEHLDSSMNQLEDNLKQTKKSIIKGADKVANDVAFALFMFFFALTLGGITSAWAGLAGVRSGALQKDI